MPCKVREKGRKEGNKAKENYIQNVGRPSKSEQISAPIKSIETRQEIAKGEGM